MGRLERRRYDGPYRLDPNIFALEFVAPWWIRVALKFKPMQVSMDWSKGRYDSPALLHFKCFRGKIYIFDLLSFKA